MQDIIFRLQEDSAHRELPNKKSVVYQTLLPNERGIFAFKRMIESFSKIRKLLPCKSQAHVLITMTETGRNKHVEKARGRTLAKKGLRKG